MNPFRQSLVLFFVLLAGVGPVHAQSSPERHPALDNPFFFSIGAFINDKEVKVGVRGSTVVIDDEIDFDDKWRFGNDETSIAAELKWRFGEKWSLGTQFFSTDDDSRAILDEDVVWGDYTFREGTNVGAGIAVDVARIFFGRKFLEGPRHELGAGIGFHWMKIDAYLDGEAFINDESTGARRESVNAAAPLPNLGLWYQYAFSSRWLAGTRVDWLDVDFDEYAGQLLNGAVSINYMPIEHLGVTFSYQYFALDVDIDKRGWRGGVDFTYRGPFLSLTATW